MCGIALIVSGVRIVGFDSYTECCRDRALHSHSKKVCSMISFMIPAVHFLPQPAMLICVSSLIFS